MKKHQEYVEEHQQEREYAKTSREREQSMEASIVHLQRIMVSDALPYAPISAMTTAMVPRLILRRLARSDALFEKIPWTVLPNTHFSRIMRGVMPSYLAFYVIEVNSISIFN